MKIIFIVSILALLATSCLSPNSLIRLNDKFIDLPIQIGKVEFDDKRSGFSSLENLKDSENSNPKLTEKYKKSVISQIINSGTAGTKYDVVVVINKASISSDDGYIANVKLTLEFTNKTKTKEFYKVDAYQKLSSKAMFASNKNLYEMYKIAFHNTVHIALEELRNQL